jgi:Cu2+-exporting ATPase
MLTAALLTARLVQDRATSYARQAAARLIELLPKQVWRVGVEGELERVALDEVEAGAVVEVRAGDRFGVDGLVVSGQTRVSRAALTGESEPEVLASGDRVEAGTLNVGGPVRVRVESAGDQTRMGKLLMWVEQRAVARAPRLQLVDKMGGWFVSAVLLVAALTALMSVGLGGQELLSRVVAVLVISCPCALGMAGPIASAVFVGRAAREGIFIKHDDVLANMSELTHVIFDKTGTLTRGELTLEVMTGSLEALAWASALERGSDHVIARAVVSAADERGVASWEAEQVEEHVGCGMSGVVGGVDVRVGRASWLGVSDRDGMLGPILERGLTPVVVEVGGEVVGVLGLGDALRPESRGLVSELRARGVEVMILSGDHQAAVWRVGEQLGLERKSCVGGVSPEGKEAHILRLQSVLGAKIALIGDGVNDAAAMQAAQVGIAVHGSAEVSLLAADIFLSARGLGGLISLFDGARGLERVVRRNLVGSAIYNAVGITLASAGYVTPLLAAVFMPLSSLSVVASSLLGLSLRRVEPTKRGDYERVILVSSAGAADGDRGGRFVPVGDP